MELDLTVKTYYSSLIISSVLPPAGSKIVIALLGRMPSAVGYQPTLATEMGAMQERITSTKKDLLLYKRFTFLRMT